jgi:hypothetical protein
MISSRIPFKILHYQPSLESIRNTLQMLVQEDDDDDDDDDGDDES